MMNLSGYTSALNANESSKAHPCSLGEVPDLVYVLPFKVLEWAEGLGNLSPGFALG